MKIVKFAAIVLFALFCTSSAQAKELVIALSPFQQQADAKAQAGALLKFLTALEAGDRAVLMDGYNLKTIGTFTVPKGNAYKSPKARLRANSAAVNSLLDFAKATGSEQPAGSLRLPQLLRFVAENIQPLSALDVIVLGSPLYIDPAEAEYSMADALVPSDAHLLASRRDSPYGAADDPALLSNVRVHVGFGGADTFVSDQHHNLIQRFWWLYVTLQGGQMISFVGDFPTLLSRVNGNAAPLKITEKPDPAAKIEMMRLRRTVIQQSLYERPLSTLPLAEGELRAAQKLEIGISWSCACDLDLYVQSTPGSAVLFYGNSETPEGIHVKDYVESTQNAGAYETIEYSVPVDLRRLRIAINFYGGNAPQGVRGEVRVGVNGQVYAAPFTISATTGNAGQGVMDDLRRGRASQAQTILISAQTIAQGKGS